MSIKNVIVHVIKRDKDGERLVKQLRNSENNREGIAEKLTDDLISLFSNATLNVGEFGVEGDPSLVPPFEKILNSHYDINLKCADFVQMTKEMANRYEHVIIGDSLRSVKGGYFVFYTYVHRREEFLAVAILQKSDGVDVNSVDLELVARQILDINKLHLGVSINLTKWRNPRNSRYIKFKTGLANEVRDYFEKFVGCQRDKEAAVKETQDLRKAVYKFAVDMVGLTSELASDKVSEASKFIKEQQKLENEILLSHIANSVFPSRVDDFLEHARNDFNLSEDISIDNSELRHFSRISGKGKGISITFDRKMLGSVVTFNPKNDTLTFKEIPVALKEEIIEELKIQKRKNEPTDS